MFYPNQCADGETKCHIAIILHGQYMNSDFYGEDFLYNSGFPEYAVSNDIILIFPQAEQLYAKNPHGLWAYSP